MKSSTVGELNEEDFRCETGIKRQTFERMIETLSSAEQKKKFGGKLHALSMEDRLLMTLSYW